jgi:hypothetical protein
MCIKINKVDKQEVGIWWVQKRFPRYGVVGSVFGPVKFLLPVCRLSWFLYILNIYAHFSSHFSQHVHIQIKCMLNMYKNQQNRQTGSRNLMDPKILPTIWGIYMKLVTKYQISAINSCWEGTPYCGKRFWTHQIPTSCLSILLIFIHI